jgi:hypothetical protein
MIIERKIWQNCHLSAFWCDFQGELVLFSNYIFGKPIIITLYYTILYNILLYYSITLLYSIYLITLYIVIYWNSIKKTKTPVKPEFLPCFQRGKVIDFTTVFISKIQSILQPLFALLFSTLFNLLLPIIDYFSLILINTFNPLKLY